MKADNWSPAQRVEDLYRRDISALIRKLLDVPDLGRGIIVMSESQFLEQWARQAAARMISGLLVHQARTWRQAARESMRGREIYAALQNELSGPVGAAVRNLVEQNAKLIESVLQTVAQRIVKYIQQEQTAGRRFEAMLPELHKMAPKLAESRIRLIARTETSKASTALTRARSEDLDIEWYQWKSSHDARVRISHRKLDGVLVGWEDAPSPEALVGERSTLGHYHAGDAPNCRCFPAPLLRLNQVQWPARVYHDGRIERMTLAQFRDRFASQQLAA